MAHFQQAFWSSDYAGGLGVLFGKLQQGVQENEQILTIARMRADAEELYGQHIGEIGPATDNIADGFLKDDGASVRKAYDGVRTEMDEASRKHHKIASNIRELVVYPFGRWCEQHSSRVQHSQDDLHGRVKAHDKQAEVVKKLRTAYFNKCRVLEDQEEEDKLLFKAPQSEPPSSPKQSPPIVKVQEPEEEEPEPIQIGDNYYEPDQVKKILTHMLETIPLGETKVPILGTYQNVSTGANIVLYVQNHLAADSVPLAEQIGQDLVNHGFLRLVGSVGREFANSTRMHYQWRPKVFKITGYPERRTGLDRTSSILSADGLDSPLVGPMGEFLEKWNPLNNPYPNETGPQRSKREAREADERYKHGVRKLDLLRCTLEEAMIEHLKFMERCELDRLKAIKSVILDFSGALSNVIPSLQSTVDKMMLFQETVQPAGDLRYLLENYRTGSFAPKVTIYENYYNSVDDQTFGVDLEARAKADRKRVPIVVTSVLMFLDHHYPLLDGDEARRAIWLVDVPLAATHRLRQEINDGKPVPPEVLEKYEVPIVASVLKLYLLELPDCLVSSNLYEIIKTVYTNPATSGSDPESTNARISVLQNTLGQLRLANIATLDAITSHFVRLLDLTSADEQYTTSLIQSLAPCILRPRTESSITFEEKYNSRFVRDLLENKDPIFNELKRSATITNRARSPARPHGVNTSLSLDAGRARAPSTDESNRRANEMERARAIASRSRASSPAPPREGRDTAPGKSVLEQQRHRRDSSRGPAETRFPVHVPGGVASPRIAPATMAAAKEGAGIASPPLPVTRNSLEVPGSQDGSPVTDRNGSALSPVTSAPMMVDLSSMNGSIGLSDSAAETPTSASTASGSPTTARNLRKVGAGSSASVGLGRHAMMASKRESGTNQDRESMASTASAASTSFTSPTGVGGEERKGVSLSDKPMDDFS